MDGHAHLGFMVGLDIVAVVLIFHFLARAWSGIRPNSPAMQGLNFVA